MTCYNPYEKYACYSSNDLPILGYITSIKPPTRLTTINHHLCLWLTIYSDQQPAACPPLWAHDVLVVFGTTFAEGRLGCWLINGWLCHVMPLSMLGSCNAGKCWMLIIYWLITIKLLLVIIEWRHWAHAKIMLGQEASMLILLPFRKCKLQGQEESHQWQHPKAPADSDSFLQECTWMRRCGISNEIVSR